MLRNQGARNPDLGFGLRAQPDSLKEGVKAALILAKFSVMTRTMMMMNVMAASYHNDAFLGLAVKV